MMRTQLAIFTLVSLFFAVPAVAGDQSQVDALVESAMTAKNAGKFDAAIKTLEAALQMAPRSEKVLIALGRTHGAQGDLKKAADFLERALTVNPKSVPANRFLSLTYARLGQGKKALQYAETAVKHGPDVWEAHHQLAELYLMSGQTKKAVASAKYVIKLKPKMADAHRSMAAVYRATGKLSKAAKAAKKAVKLAPNGLANRLTLAGIYTEQKNITSAKRELKKAEKIGTGHLRALETIAAAYTLIGESKDALRIYKGLVKDHPKSFTVQLAMANLYLLTGAVDKAKGHANKAKAIEPKAAEPHQVLGLCAAAKKDFKGAEVSLRKAISLQPKNYELRLALAGLYAQTNQLPKSAIEFEAVLAAVPKARGIRSPLCQVYRALKKSGEGPKKMCLAACKEVGIAPKDCATP